jgi:hypothetical protein
LPFYLPGSKHYLSTISTHNSIKGIPVPVKTHVNGKKHAAYFENAIMPDLCGKAIFTELANKFTATPLCIFINDS